MTVRDAATGQLKFFVSYTKDDRAWAEWIAWQIEAAGHAARIQAWDFEPGGNFVSEMNKAAKWADVTMPVLSPDFAKSEFGEAEWTAAFAQDPLGNKGRLVPVRVRQFEVDGLLKPLVFIDLVGLGKDAARDELVRGLQRGRRKPVVEPDFPPDLEGAFSAPTREPVFPGKPDPSFSSDRSRELSLQLTAAYTQLKQRVRDNQPADDIHEIIRDLKSRLREGGQLEAGEKLCEGRYELLEEVGQGGFAHVWRAWNNDRHEAVAIKVLHKAGRQRSLIRSILPRRSILSRLSASGAWCVAEVSGSRLGGAVQRSGTSGTCGSDSGSGAFGCCCLPSPARRRSLALERRVCWKT